MKAHIRINALAAVLASLLGCDRQTAISPPTVRLGDSLCNHCNMIISDERWATATMVEGPRGSEPRLFDDFNCQVNFEVAHPDLTIMTRWSHDYVTREWLRTEHAQFLISTELRTPMGSMMGAFRMTSDAETIKTELTGEVMTFDDAWKHLKFIGTHDQADQIELDSTGPEQHNES